MAMPISTSSSMQFNSVSPQASETLGAKIGQKLRGGEVIELVSDLGGGKTTFTRGLVQGTGSNNLVSSPTFTICNRYRAKQLTIYHFDFYRLSDAGLMEHELAEAFEDPNGVVVIEWSDVVAHVLLTKRLTIDITAKDEDSRQFKLTYPKSLEYLVEGL